MATIAGSEGGGEEPDVNWLCSSALVPRVEDISEFNVGWEGRLGSVGDGSRSRRAGFEKLAGIACGCSGMVPLTPTAAPLRNEVAELTERP